MVAGIKKIISFFDERKNKIEEQIRIKNENLKLLNKEKEKLATEIKKFQKGFFSKIKREKKASVHFDFRQNVDFCKTKIMEIESGTRVIESEIESLKAELINLAQRLKALEKYENRLEKQRRTTIAKKEEKEINDLIMVKYCDKQDSK